MKPSFPLITAHSGFDGTQPNTVESALIGIEAGADFIEVDVRATKDNIAVLFHDEIIATGSNGSFRISDLTFAELVALVNNDGLSPSHKTRIVRVEEVIEAVGARGSCLNLDLKDDLCVVPAVAAVKAAGMVESVILSGCRVEKASFIKKNNSGFQVLLNADEELFQSTTDTSAEIVQKVCHAAVSASCCGINVQLRYLSEEIVDCARKRYLPVSVWTLCSKDKPEDYLAMGLYSITTLAVKTLIEKRGQIC